MSGRSNTKHNTRRRRRLFISLYGNENAIGKCNYCGKLLTFRETTLDHKTPKVLGGSNDINNLAISCQKCNNDKEMRVSKLMNDLYQNKKTGRHNLPPTDILKKDLERCLSGL